MRKVVPKEIDSYDVLGIPISVVTLDIAANKIAQWAKDNIGRFICLRDVASLMICLEEPNLKELHQEATIVSPDGMPLAVIGKLKGLPVQKTSGADLMSLVLSLSAKTGLKHYFYGGKEGVAKKLADVCKEKYPNIKIAGYECPPFRPLTKDEDKEVIKRIKASSADIVWVGISSPKQDIWMQQHYKKLPQTLIGVGAAFDFLTGEVKRAPKWMQNSGLEWSHRLFSEPKRLWRRYLILAPKFIVAIALDSIKSNINKHILRKTDEHS